MGVRVTTWSQSVGGPNLWQHRPTSKRTQSTFATLQAQLPARGTDWASQFDFPGRFIPVDRFSLGLKTAVLFGQNDPALTLWIKLVGCTAY